ncbi:MAG: Omp85 family outer membrane protein [Bacteroidales bacterium]
MCKRLIPLLLLLLTSAILHAQDEPKPARVDKIKTGWNFGVLPAISYDENLGFQYGGLVNFFYFGDGSTYPQYKHSLFAEVSQYTKGSTVFRTYYDGNVLLPNIRSTLDVAYIEDKMMKFHGFNGYQGLYQPAYIEPQAEQYISEGFYSYNRSMLRVASTLQGKIYGKFLWGAGLDVYNFAIKSLDYARFELPSDSTAYDYLVAYGGIPESEKNGGFHLYLKGSIMYDSRDFEPAPTKGMCTELLFYLSPDFQGKGRSHARLTFTHRQYLPLIPQTLTFAYRLGYQGVLFGQVPWYLQQNVNVLIYRRTLSEGLGSNATLRGTVRNRIVGNGIVFGNAELRWRFFHFSLIKQNFYLALNPFVDAGMVVQEYRKDELLEMQKNIQQYSLAKPQLVVPQKEVPHVTTGVGLQAVMNQNFVVSVDFGKALDKRDGNSGFYIGLNYIF